MTGIHSLKLVACKAALADAEAVTTMLWQKAFSAAKARMDQTEIYSTRDEARSDVFDYIEMLYNSKRKHGSSNQLSLVEYENRYQERLGSV
ncbi:IS3 family transposase [Plesiomonas shigelloides]|uniref:IS3 family transposase n=1 Tax=Plesiomonas shigelloides TaxID=703 RepID=UPI0022A886E9|nr:IS3 family transposase [Plesiomonas shigelloides]